MAEREGKECGARTDRRIAVLVRTWPGMRSSNKPWAGRSQPASSAGVPIDGKVITEILRDWKLLAPREGSRLQNSESCKPEEDHLINYQDFNRSKAKTLQDRGGARVVLTGESEHAKFSKGAQSALTKSLSNA